MQADYVTLNGEFSKWWFLDTCCYSELAKFREEGWGSEISSMFSGRHVLLTSPVIAELSAAPRILRELERCLGDALLYLVADIERFWYADLSNFLNVERVPFNALGVQPIDASSLPILGSSEKIHEAATADRRVREEGFEVKVSPDVGAKIDERDLGAFIWDRVNTYAKKWFKISIPPEECSSAHFPAFFTFYYTYYYRYIMSDSVRPNANDLVDLMHVLAAPYCERMFMERSYGSLLRDTVQGKKPPSAYALIKRMRRRGAISDATWQNAQKNRERLRNSNSLLADVEISLIEDLKDEIMRGGQLSD